MISRIRTAPLLADGLPAGHVLREAQWIWPGANTYLENCFAHFRRDFTLRVPPKRAPFFITADQHYRLSVNGTYVTRGPARGYQAHWPYDEVDLAPFLRSGANWIAVEAYNPGISTFQYLHRSSAGLLCAARWGSFTLLSDKEWIARRSPAHREHTDRLSLQLDFQEHVDVRLDDRQWITAPTPPSNWTVDARLYGPHLHCSAFSRPPWEAVEARGIPQLEERHLTPKRVFGTAQGPCAAGWREWANVAWPFTAEGKAATWAPEGITAREVDGWLEFTVPAPGPERWTAVAIDVGEYVWASAELCVAGALGGEIIDLLHQERPLGNRGELRKPGDNCIIALGNRLMAAPGTCTHDFYHLLGFRVITAVVRGATSPLTLRLRLRTGIYPFTMRGRFACSDPLLESIQAACARTQRICSGDAYVDTPWREQAQWWGDARVQAANTFHLDGDARLLARGIRSIAGQDGPGGLTYGHAPTMAYNCILPDFSLTWMLTLRDHWWQTGDATLVREQWPRALRILGYFDGEHARHRSGLLCHDRRLWLFEDWSTLWKGEVPTFLNLWYLHTLHALIPCLLAAGMRRDAAALKRRYAAHARLCLAKLWDRKRQRWLAGLDAPKGEESVHDQTLELLNGLVPKAHDGLVRDFLLPFLRGEKLPGAKPSAFWSYYVLLEAGRRGFAAECLAFIRRYWEPMLASGTTWEDYTWSEDGGGTASHAWTAHPCVHFPQILAGIRQQAPGWSAVEIAPQPIAGLDHAAALVPSPRGDISSRWERRGHRIHLAVSVPKGMRASVRLGDQRKLLPAGGKIVLEG